MISYLYRDTTGCLDLETTVYSVLVLVQHTGTAVILELQVTREEANYTFGGVSTTNTKPKKKVPKFLYGGALPVPASAPWLNGGRYGRNTRGLSRTFRPRNAT